MTCVLLLAWCSSECKCCVSRIYAVDFGGTHFNLIIWWQTEMRTLRHHLRATYQREAVYYSDKRRKAESALRDATEEVCAVC